MAVNLGQLARWVCQLLVFFALSVIVLFIFCHDFLGHSHFSGYSSQPTYIIHAEQSIT